jgi:hypothetical protein
MLNFNELNNFLVAISEKNPLTENVPEQCDPYSSFGVFCNTNSIWEGLFVIFGVILLVVASLWFVKKNQESNGREFK